MTLKILPAAALLSVLVTFCSFLFPPQTQLLTRKKTLSVLCYNIHHASPPSKPGSIDLDAIAQVINHRQPDLVALQEVDVYTKRSGPYNQAEELGKKTGMSAYFFKAIDYDGGEYGVAILSKFPVTETKRHPLPRAEGSPGEPRVLGTAMVRITPRQFIMFATTHLDARRDSIDRLLQIKSINRQLESVKVPIVIAGDFNAVPGTEVIKVLDSNFTRTCNPCDFTIPVNTPKRAIDFIAYSPSESFKVKDHVVIPERYASDHLPIFAELEIKF